ncbi:MAG: hypothetical protein U0X20_10830 [Caldilineaceae bacterium]
MNTAPFRMWAKAGKRSGGLGGRRGRLAGMTLLLAAMLGLIVSVGLAQTALAQAPINLPAPVYLLDAPSGQIVRLANDGVTRRTVTHELSPVTSFDVSPDGAKLAYVTGNRLIEAQADGSNRVVKLSGGAIKMAGAQAGAAEAQLAGERIDAPLYSPDGSRIAFAHGGINLIASGPDAVGPDAVTLVLPNDLLPNGADRASTDSAPDRAAARIYKPNSWSPDGVHLLVDYTYYPEGGGLAILAPDSNILVELTPDPNAEDPMAIPMFGDVAWKPDSTSFFIGSAMVYYGAPGLSLVDAGTGVATGILTSPQMEVSEEAPLLAVRGPYWTTSGGLRAYVSEQASVEVPAPYSLEEIDPATGDRTPLNEVTYPAPGSVLWAQDDSGALLLTDMQNSDGTQGAGTLTGPVGSLHWAAASGEGSYDGLSYLAYGRAPRWGSNDYGSAPAQEQEVVAQFEQAIDLQAARAGQDPAPFGPSAAFPVDVNGSTYWVAHTTGTRSFNPDKPHTIGVYTQADGQWQQLSLLELGGTQDGTTAGPDYLNENSVLPVEIGPGGTGGGTTSDGTQLWLQVEGGAGAHGGVCNIVRLAGDLLSEELDNFSSSGGACQVMDIDGDGANEVVLDATDYYVFCYACGVRKYDYTVQRWNGKSFDKLELQPLPAAAPEELVAKNDELLRLVQGGLWKAALELVAAPNGASANAPVTATDELSGTASTTDTLAATGTVTDTGTLSATQGITPTGDPSGVYNTNVALVRLVGDARKADAEAAEHPYPLLAQVFYGDYPAAVDVMQVYTVSEVFAQPSALISGTVAAGWDGALAGWLTTTASSAIGVNDRLAAAYFVRGFGEWLGGITAATTGDVPPNATPVVGTPGALAIDQATLDAAVADMRKALELSPNLDQAAYYAAAISLLTGEEVATPSAAGTGSSGSLQDMGTITGTVGISETGAATGTAPVSATAAVTSTGSLTTSAAGGQGRLLYSTVQDGEDRIYLLEFGAANATLNEVLGQARQPALQPGGVRVAYQSTRPDMLGLGGYDLDGGTERFNFTTNTEDGLPRWSPDGSKLAFSSTRFGDGRSRVYTAWPQVAGFGSEQPMDQGEGSDPDWSPDGTRIVYKGCDASGANCGLWTMAPTDGGASDQRQLTNNANDSRPRWSPDGSRVVFMSDGRDGNYDVYSVAVNPDSSGGEVTRITFNAASDGLPAISPDGSEIVFVSNRGNQWGIWRVPIESGKAVSVVGDLGAVTNWLEQGLDWVK